MVAAALLTKTRLPKGRELWLTALYGAMILGLGSGAIALTETWLPTGLAALFVTALLMAALDRLHAPFSITLFGVVSAACFFVPGLKYYRQRVRQERQRSRAEVELLERG